MYTITVMDPGGSKFHMNLRNLHFCQCPASKTANNKPVSQKLDLLIRCNKGNQKPWETVEYPHKKELKGTFRTWAHIK